MAIYAADLHVHTVLSPCAEVEMIPPFIVASAIKANLDIIAITDHNSADNVEAVLQAAQDTSLKVIPGIECESVEGVHIICLFDHVDAVMSMQEFIYAGLPDLRNKPEIFGAQFKVDAYGEFVSENDRLLLVSTEYSIEEIAERVDLLGGITMPAHVDRPAYGIYNVLGFLPEEPGFKAVEISQHITSEMAVEKYPDLKGKRIFQSSDAHRLEEIGSARTMLKLNHRTVQDIQTLLSI